MVVNYHAKQYLSASNSKNDQGEQASIVNTANIVLKLGQSEPVTGAVSKVKAINRHINPVWERVNQNVHVMRRESVGSFFRWFLRKPGFF